MDIKSQREEIFKNLTNTLFFVDVDCDCPIMHRKVAMKPVGKNGVLVTCECKPPRVLVCETEQVKEFEEG